MRALIALVLLGTASAASAQVGPYAGFALGGLNYSEPTSSTRSYDDNTPTYRLYGGYRISETWGIEGILSTVSSVDGSIPLNRSFRTKFDPIVEVRGLAYFGRFLAGLGLWDANTTHSRTTRNLQLSQTRSDSGLSLIIGGEWQKDKWGIRLEYELMDSDTYSHPSTLTLGGHFRIGGR